MGKVKIKRKSTLIDMTAMSDVTVLLLTFFMLTSTFLQKEPVTVMTPSSVSEEKVPVANLTQILVSPEGKVFISLAGDPDSKENPDWGTEPMRIAVLERAVSEYNRLHPSKQIKLSPQQKLTFSKINAFGVPFQALPSFLSLSQLDQDKIMQDMTRADVGIPVNDNRDLDHPNEFQIWMRAIYNSGNDNLQSAMKKGEGIAVKADRGTEYRIVQNVLDNLQTLKMNRFSIMTALKTEQD
ncbi:MAG: biopolymer transporter ExbD [Muribaculaceae bacterium]|nr:biopolymer transporter ExbD [Muribaculaceae bacterium]